VKKIDPNSVLTDEQMAQIRKTAYKIMELAIQECPNAMQAIGALLLASGTGAAYGHLDIDQAVDLFETYYTNAAIDDAQATLAESEGVPRTALAELMGKLN
jgi:hypothetical protein